MTPFFTESDCDIVDNKILTSMPPQQKIGISLSRANEKVAEFLAKGKVVYGKK